VINRRHSYLDRDPHRFPRAGIKPKPRSVLTGRSISGTGGMPDNPKQDHQSFGSGPHFDKTNLPGLARTLLESVV